MRCDGDRELFELVGLIPLQSVQPFHLRDPCRAFLTKGLTIALTMEAVYRCTVTFVCFVFTSTFPTPCISLTMDCTMTVVIAIEAFVWL